MTTYYKAVRPDGTDFFTGTVQWIPTEGVPAGGWLVEHPTERDHCTSDASRYLSVSTVQTDCTGMAWPCRLLRVEPVGRVGTTGDGIPSKRCAQAWRVVEELDPHLALGPQGREVAAIIERAGRLSAEEAVQAYAALDAAQDAARDAAWDAARDAARDAIRNAARDAAGGAAWCTAAWGATRYAARDAAWDRAGKVVRDVILGTLVRDLISDEHYQALVGPWRSVVPAPDPDEKDSLEFTLDVDK